MPTYINNTNDNVNLELRTIPPGGIISTEFILDISTNGLTKTSDEPYFNPVTSSMMLSSSGPGDDLEVNIEAESNILEIINQSDTCIVTMFFESLSNTPGLPIGYLDGSKELLDRDDGRYGRSLKNKVTKLIFQFSVAMPANTFYVIQRKY